MDGALREEGAETQEMRISKEIIAEHAGHQTLLINSRLTISMAESKFYKSSIFE